MLWVFYALICAFSLSTADALSKKILRTESVPLIVWIRNGYAIPFVLLTIPFVPIPQLDATFWKAAAAALPCDIIALLLYMRAIQISPLSLTLPFLSLTPIFLLGTSWLILGEFPDASGLAGILLIVVGAYALNAHSWREGWLSPIKAIAKERGSLLMVGVAFVYSLSSNFGKIAITHSSPVFFGVYYQIVLTIVLTPALWLNGKGGWRQAFSEPKKFFPIGFCIALMMLTHFLAIELTLVSYMISVKRTSLIFGVVYGALMFKEDKIRERLLGSILMLIGVVLIVLP